MRILLISPICPFPLEKGGAVRIWNIAQQLSNHHSIDLLCFIRSEQERIHEDTLKKVFRNVHFVVRREIVSPRVLLEKGLQKLSFFAQNFSLAKDSLLSSRPLLSVLYDHPEILRYVQIADAEREYDLMYAETYYAASALFSHICELKTPFFLCEQNVEYAAYVRQLETQSNHFIRLLMQFDVWKMRREEIVFWKQAPKLGGLSRVDVQEISDESGREDVVLLENGVDVAWFSEKRTERVPHEVLFVGSFSYFQNVDALKWLLEEIWPKVTAHHNLKIGDVRLRIVGRGADHTLKEYVQSTGNEIDESVDDIRDAFQHATLLIAPIRAGSGTKYKVLEAMASHCPVITTTVGAEGLDVENKREMIIADSATDLAEHLVEVLNDQALAQNMGVSAYQFVSRSYDWSQVVDNFEQKVVKQE